MTRNIMNNNLLYRNLSNSNNTDQLNALNRNSSLNTNNTDEQDDEQLLRMLNDTVNDHTKNQSERHRV